MTVVNMRRLEAAHHDRQLRILGDTWRDEIRNEEIRWRTRMETVEVILGKIGLQWLGHVRRTDDRRIPCQALTWFPKDGKSGPGRPRKSWSDTVTVWGSAEHRDDVGRLPGDCWAQGNVEKLCRVQVFPELVEGLRFKVRSICNEKHWDSAYLHQGTSYTDPDPYPDCHKI